MDSFKCHCRSRKCRKVIRGTDYLEDFVERYGDHLSDYVKVKRLAERDAHPTREEIYQ